MKATQRKFSQTCFLTLTVLITLLCAANVFAASYTAAASGDWNANSTWSPNTGHPVAGDIATINAAFTVTVSDIEACATLNVQTSGSAVLTVTNGGALTVSGTTILNNSATINVNSGGTLTLATATLTLGAVNNNGTMTCGSTLSGVPTITMGAGGILYIGGTATLTGTINNTAGTVVYNGSSQSIKALTYCNLQISDPVASPATLAASTTVAGNLEILNGGGLNVAASRTLNVTGATAIDSGATLTFSASSAAGTLGNNVSVSGTLNFSTTSGIITINGATTVNNGGTLSFGAISAGVTFAGDVTVASGSTWSETVAAKPFFGGNFYNNGATAFTVSTGTHTFKGATPNIGGTSTVALNAVTFGDGVNGCNPVSYGAGGFTISGTLTIAAGNTTYDNIGTLGVGNLIVNGTCANDGTLTVTTLTTIATTGTLNNNSPHTFTGNTGTFTGGAINNNGTMSFSGAITGTGTTVTQGANASLTFGNTLTAFTLVASASGNTVNYSRASTQTILGATYYNLTTSGGAGIKTLGGNTAVNGTLTIGAGTTLDVSSANNYALSVGGNWVNNGTFTARSGTVTFNGSANQAVTGKAVIFSNVIVNNTGPAGNNTVTIYGGGSVGGTTTITVGNLVFVGPVVQLIWSTPPPASISPNTIITPYPVLQTADANGNPSTVGLAASQMITVSLNGPGTLSGTTNYDIGTASTNGSTGTVICSNLSVSGGGVVTLIASPDTGLNPANVPGIYVWLDGSDSNSMTFSGSTITAWNDKSGNGNNFDATFTSLATPGPITLTSDTTNLNGRTGVFFPGDSTAGTGASLGCSTININNDTLSVYAMVKQTAAIPAFYRLCAFANAASADYDAAGLYVYFNPNLLVARGNIQLGGGAAKPAIGTPWLGEAIFNGSTCTTALLQKGAATGTSSASSSGNFSLTEATVGGALNAGYTSGGAYWSGPVYEYLIYTNALSAANQAAVETYLINKWIPNITNNATASFNVGGSSPLSISLSGGNAIISWSGSGTLQSSDSVTNGSIWATIPGASSPYSTPVSGTQMYFRLAP